MSLLHKTKQQKRNNDPLIRLMTPMIAGILACVFCLVSMTWAWFTASVDTPTQTIQSANRSTSVKVYEISQNEDENRNVTKTLVMPQISEEISLDDDTQATADEGTIIAGETAVWELDPEKTYEVVMTGSGTASTGYCEITLSHTASGSDTSETTQYKTSEFQNGETFEFTYHTGGFESVEGVTNTQWTEYVQNTTPPTLTITSYWGKPANEELEELSDGDKLGLVPIPCPEAKAEVVLNLVGFEIQDNATNAVISAEEDYKILLKLKEGYKMPDKVVVNIGDQEYKVSTQAAQISDDAPSDAPYYDTKTGVLTVPTALLSDGIKVSINATATQVPKEDGEKDSDEPVNTPADDGGNDDDNDKSNNTSEGSSTDNDSSSDNNEEKTEDEKANVTPNLSQLTNNLEETKAPTNADKQDESEDTDTTTSSESKETSSEE